MKEVAKFQVGDKIRWNALEGVIIQITNHIHVVDFGKRKGSRGFSASELTLLEPLTPQTAKG